MANVQLTEAMEEYVSAQISAGTYSSVSDAVHAGLRLLMEQDGAQAFFRLRTELQAAHAQASSSQTTPFDPSTFLGGEQ